MDAVLGNKLVVVNHDLMLVLHRQIRSVSVTPDLSHLLGEVVRLSEYPL